MKKIFLVAAPLLLLAACKPDGQEEKLVQSIIVTPDALQLETGLQDTLAVEYVPADAVNKSVVWSSSAPSMADVDPDGVVTAISAGEAVITANCDGVEDSCRVTVSEPVPPAPVEDFEIVIGEIYEEDGARYVPISWYPADKEMVYFPFMTQAELYEGRTDEQFVNEYYETLRMMAQLYGYSFEEYLGAFLKTGDFSGSSVIPSSGKYYAIAYGCEADGTPTTDVYAVGFEVE